MHRLRTTVPKTITVLNGSELTSISEILFSTPRHILVEIPFKKINSNLSICNMILAMKMGLPYVDDRDEFVTNPTNQSVCFQFRAMQLVIDFKHKKIVFEPQRHYMRTTANQLRANVIANHGNLLLIQLPECLDNSSLDYNARLVNTFIHEINSVKKLVIIGSNRAMSKFLKAIHLSRVGLTTCLYVAQASLSKTMHSENYIAYLHQRKTVMDIATALQKHDIKILQLH